MSRPWRVRVRRKDGNNCDHLSNVPCEVCAAERQQHFVPRSPLAVSFYLSAEQLASTAFAPWERPHAIESRGELLRFCEKNGLDSKYLKESSHWHSRKPREQ